MRCPADQRTHQPRLFSGRVTRPKRAAKEAVMPADSSATREAVAERVARVLREAIDSGEYPPGVLLPSEKLIASNLEVSAPTVRESLAILSAEGRVRTVNGKGTLVLEQPVPRHVIAFDPADPWRD